MNARLSTGTAALDWLLEGGYERDIVTVIYGPPGVGKTNLCLLAMAFGVKDKKIIYIDTEGSFSAERLQQMTERAADILDRTIFLRPVNFAEQEQAFLRLQKIVTDKVDLIVLDSIAMLYRLELGKTKSAFDVNRQLGVQLATLTEIARKKQIPVLVTNQVYSDVEREGAVKIVGGDILKYQSKCLIELQHDGEARLAILRKHRSLPADKAVRFRIVDAGIEEISADAKKPLERRHDPLEFE